MQTEPDWRLGLDDVIKVIKAVKAVLTDQLVVVEVADHVQLCLYLFKQGPITRHQLREI